MNERSLRYNLLELFIGNSMFKLIVHRLVRLLSTLGIFGLEYRKGPQNHKEIELILFIFQLETTNYEQHRTPKGCFLEIIKLPEELYSNFFYLNPYSLMQNKLKI